MKRNSNPGFTWNELLLVLVILFLAAGPALRFIFRDEYRRFDEAVWRSLGLPPDARPFVIGFVIVLYCFARAASYLRERRLVRRQQRQPFITLPLNGNR